MPKEQLTGRVVEFREPFYKQRQGLEEYEAALRISREEMRDKKVLDIGLSVPFMVDCFHEGLTVTAIRNGCGDYVSEKLGRNLRSDRVEALGFDDDSFDLVLALSSVPCCVRNGESFDLVLSFYQMLRVCRPDGKVVVSPMPTVTDMTLKRCLDMGDLTYPYQKKWPVDLVELFCRCGIGMRTYSCEKPFEGQFAVHLEKKENTDLEPMIDWIRINRPGYQV